MTAQAYHPDYKHPRDVDAMPNIEHHRIYQVLQDQGVPVPKGTKAVAMKLYYRLFHAGVLQEVIERCGEDRIQDQAKVYEKFSDEQLSVQCRGHVLDPDGDRWTLMWRLNRHDLGVLKLVGGQYIVEIGQAEASGSAQRPLKQEFEESKPLLLRNGFEEVERLIPSPDSAVETVVDQGAGHLLQPKTITTDRKVALNDQEHVKAGPQRTIQTTSYTANAGRDSAVTTSTQLGRSISSRIVSATWSCLWGLICFLVRFLWWLIRFLVRHRQRVFLAYFALTVAAEFYPFFAWLLRLIWWFINHVRYYSGITYIVGEGVDMFAQKFPELYARLGQLFNVALARFCEMVGCGVESQKGKYPRYKCTLSLDDGSGNRQLRL